MQQHQQQNAQLAEAQRLFEMHQQQQLLAQQQQLAQEDQLARSGPVSPGGVFEDSSPEPTPQPVRGQLNQTFTFGKRRDTNDDKSGRTPNRSEAAAGLGGLAARAHRRTGSEMTPAMEEQVSLINVVM
jgi:protein SSD1